MSDSPPDQADPEAATSPGSVFGNLPDSRPGGRSPRRDATKSRKSPTTKAAAKPKAKKAAKTMPVKPKPAPSKPTPAPTPPPEPAAAEGESGGGLEEIAWAGVAAAAEAATLGIRLANRALEALRGTSEKG